MVAGWTPDGRDVLFLSQRQSRFPRRDVAAYAVPASGGLARRLPPETAGLLSLSPDGNAIAFDRTFRTFGGDRWKRYRGGQVPKIFVLDLRTGRQRRVTGWAGTDTAPMWWRDRLYFLSDRGAERRLNVWVMNPWGRAPRQVTHFAADDVDVPALGADAITFGDGGRLWRLDLADETLHAVTVVLDPGDRLRPRQVAAGALVHAEDGHGIADAALSPDGRTVVLSSYGHLLVAGPGGAARSLTADAAVAEDAPSVSPDGRMVAFVTDAGGDPQVAVRALDGGATRLLTHVAGSVFHVPIWSPDGAWLAVADAEHALWLVRADGGGAARIALDRYADIRDACFSPDGRRLAYSTTRATGLRALHLHDLATGRDDVASSPFDDDHAPAFAANDSLLFLSARREYPVRADRDGGPDIVTAESDGLFRVALPPPGMASAGGLTHRAVPVATAPGVLSAPVVRGGRLFYRTAPPDLVAGTLPGPPPALRVLDLATGRDGAVADGDDPVVSADGGTALLRRDGTWLRVDVATGAAAPLDLAAAVLAIDPRTVWRKDVDEAWHLDRDLFWDRSMNGLDWPAVGRHYATLARLSGSHEDAVFLLGEMEGELSASHFFVSGGDDGDARVSAPTALLGADFAPDPASGRYRLARIFRGDPSRPRFRSPLDDGAAAHDGDTVLAIDGQDLRVPDDPYRLLPGRQGPVTLTLAAADGAPSRTVEVLPVASEVPLRQLDWIERNRARVAARSGGRVGYVFLGNFSESGTEDFDRQFYAQTDRAGLVFDDRWNTGGDTSQWVISVLRRQLAGHFLDREGGMTTLPGSVPPTALAVVTNIFSNSDGDQFPYFMRRLHLATVVGERTWGGVSGIDQPWQLIDGTGITIPKDRLFAPDGRSILENRGAEPDITVADEPAGLMAGRDAQLDRATSVVLARTGQRAPGRR